MKKCLLILWLLVLTNIFTQAQNIDAIEYFLDIDPGYGLGISVPVSGNMSNEPNIVIGVATNVWPEGLHHLFVRTKAAGVWSGLSSKIIYKINGTSSLVDKVEYFFDTDPGYGLGTQVAVASAADIANVVANVNVSSLSEGLHSLFIRSRDNAGLWSILSSKIIYKINGTSSLVDKVEYFFDTDPGYGLGTQVAVTSAADVTNIVANLDVSSLSEGIHSLFIRSRDNAGRWSVLSNNLIYKTNGVSSVVDKVEYFFNTDPGYGLGTQVAVTSAADIGNVVANVNVSSLSDGLHALYVRSRDDTGRWTVVSHKIIYIINGTFSLVDKVEYFFDNDPGYGLGTQVVVTSATDIANVIASIDITTIAQGLHILYLRVRDDQGRWSIVGKNPVVKINGTAGDITKLEYFIDTDPGFGQGINVPIQSGPDLQNVLVNVDLASLSIGVHTLYIRSKNTWGLTAKQIFYKSPTSGLITEIEYFFNADPGIGQGTNIPLVSNIDIVDLSYLINVTSLPNGFNSLFIRSKDAQGLWSLSYVHPFEKTNPLATEFIAFDAKKYNESQVLIHWSTANELNVENYSVERSKNGVEYTVINNVKANNENENNYKFIDEYPIKGLNYYRIRQTDFDGKSINSEVRMVDFIDDQLSISVYNNPSSSPSISVSQNLDYKVFSTDGRLVQSGQINENSPLYINQNLLPSSYFVVLLNGAEVIKSLTILKTQ